MKVEELYDLPKGAIIEQYLHPPKWEDDRHGSWFFEKMSYDVLKCLQNTYNEDGNNVKYYISDLSTEDVEFIYHGIREDW